MKSLDILFEIFNVIRMIVNVPQFEESLELETAHSQHLTGLIMRKRSCTVAFDRQRLQSLTARIGVLSKIIGQLDSDPA